MYVGLNRVGEHLGGYDEWTVDITDAAAQETGDVRLAVLGDNSRDAESIPSDLSDFNRCGGLARHMHLRLVPAVFVERLHVEPQLGADGRASVKIRARAGQSAGRRR